MHSKIKECDPLMKILIQISIVFGICWIGEGMARLLPLPGSVISMVLLLLLLLIQAVKPEHIREKSDFLLQNMAFFFIPAGVAILESFDVLAKSLIPFLTVCFLSTIITFAVTAFTVRSIIWLQKRLARSEKEDSPRA